MNWQSSFAGIRVNARAGAQWPAGFAGPCAGLVEKRLREILTTHGYELRYRNRDLAMLKQARLDLARELFQSYELGDGTRRVGLIESYNQLTEGEVSALFKFLEYPASTAALTAWLEEAGWI